MAVGIETRHARSCRSLKGGRCDCEPSYRASVWDGRNKQRVKRTFPNFSEAQSWHTDAVRALRRGRSIDTSPAPTLNDVVASWIDGAEKGAIRNRSGDRYKPATIRDYERALRIRVLPVHGNEKITDVQRIDLQELVDGLVADGIAASTINVTIAGLQTVYRREVTRGRVTTNPAYGLELPAARGRRDRIANPDEAVKLIAALSVNDQAVWATAFYAGLRRGELMALRVDDVDFDAGVIRVSRSWDAVSGEQQTKSRNRRRVPIAQTLNVYLKEHRMRSGRRGTDLLFGRTATLPFSPTRLTERARTAWKNAKLERITLHSCRHTFASYMIAAGANAKAISSYMGHASIAITYDRYGHLMPGNEEEAAGLLDNYLTRTIRAADEPAGLVHSSP